MRQLTPPSTSLKPEDTPLISLSERERKRVETEFLSPDPVSPSSTDGEYVPEIQPSPSHHDIPSHHEQMRVILIM